MTKGCIFYDVMKKDLNQFRQWKSTKAWPEAKTDTTSAPPAVYRGFFEAFKNIEPWFEIEWVKLLRQLITRPDGHTYHILLTGHSLGGALATIAALRGKELARTSL